MLWGGKRVKLDIRMVLLAGASALGLDVAHGQTAANQAAASEQLEEVTVTGSRVITDGSNSPTPLTTVTPEALITAHPTNVFQALLDLPEFMGSPGPQTANPGGGGGNNNNISALNLHGIGAIRTLTLWDGHRLGPTQQNGFVNANMIPQMLLQRVDIVTGGASAVYGSDAMSGVVNFITDTKFTGLKVEMKGGITQAHRDPTFRAGAAFGTDLFDGRGHFEGSISEDYQGGIMHRGDLPQWSPNWTDQGLGTQASPYYLVPNAVISSYSFGGKITGPAKNPLLNYTFDTNGVATPFANGAVTPNSSIQIGGDGAYINTPSLVARENLQQVFSRFDLDVSDNVHWNVVGTASLDHTFNWWLNNNAVMTLSASNAFLPAAYQAQMQNAGITTFNLSKYWYSYNGMGLPSLNTDFYERNFIFSTGLNGKVGRYDWDFAYTHTLATLESQIHNSIDNGRFSAALDAVAGPNGPVCYISTTQYASRYPGCVPLNVLGPSAESQAAINYIMTTQTVRLQLPTDDYSASVHGPLFDDWAGTVNGALSTDFRSLGYTIDSTALPAFLQALDCSGLRYNCTPQNLNPPAGQGIQYGTALYGSGATAYRPQVTMDVWETAVEAGVPLLKDLPLAKAVDLDIAGRYASYRVNGSQLLSASPAVHTFLSDTWKLGLVWHLNDTWTVRASRSRDFRAPTLNDLFQPQTVSNGTNGFPDVLNNTFPFATGVSAGNPNLKPETSYTGTLGVVFKPNDSFNISLDGWDTQIANVLVSQAGTSTTGQAACYASGGTSVTNNPANNFYCTLIVRDPATNVITSFITVNTNAALEKTWGADVEANYRMDLRGHPLSVRLIGSWQPHVLVYAAGQPIMDYAGTVNGNPANGTQESGAYRYIGFIHYGVSDRLTVDWSTKWHSGLHTLTNTTAAGLPGAQYADATTTTPAVMYSNVTFTYDFGDQRWGKASAFFNMSNVFNQRAPITAFPGAQGQPGLFGGASTNDDPLGRVFNVGVNYKL
jgi:outer membrane receptor protein involved in Fe transport